LLTPGGDARWVASLGIPTAIILIIGIAWLLAGVWGISRLLPLAGIEPGESFGKKYLIVMVGMGSLMLIRAIYSSTVSTGSLVENLVPMVFSLLLAVFVVLLNHLVTPKLGMANSIEVNLAPRSVWIVSLLLGVLMFTFQIFAFN
jgi:hypothetical protein